MNIEKIVKEMGEKICNCSVCKNKNEVHYGRWPDDKETWAIWCDNCELLLFADSPDDVVDKWNSLHK